MPLLLLNPRGCAKAPQWTNNLASHRSYQRSACQFLAANLRSLGGTQVALLTVTIKEDFIIVTRLRKNVYFNRNTLLLNATGHEERISTAAEIGPRAFTTRTNIKKILAPTDLSPLSEAGVRYALNVGRELGAEVIIYHAITGNEIAAFGRRRIEKKLVPLHYRGLIESYEMRLKNFIEAKFGDAVTSVRMRQKVEFGTPETSIVESAKAEAVDLIIMAGSRKRGLARMFLGSVTEEVIRNAPCPVVAIPAHFAGAHEGEAHKAAA
jgi:nucleotide-binding universal stress UspA family protein